MSVSEVLQLVLVIVGICGLFLQVISIICNNKKK